VQLLAHQQNVDALRDLACRGIDLLMTNQFELLVQHYGYALALGRNPVNALRRDFAQALSDASGSELLPMKARDLPVVFYQDSSSGIRAAIDCEVPTRTGRSVGQLRRHCERNRAIPYLGGHVRRAGIRLS
jgi:hypothetical protein